MGWAPRTPQASARNRASHRGQRVEAADASGQDRQADMPAKGAYEPGGQAWHSCSGRDRTAGHVSRAREADAGVEEQAAAPTGRVL